MTKLLLYTRHCCDIDSCEPEVTKGSCTRAQIIRRSECQVRKLATSHWTLFVDRRDPSQTGRTCLHREGHREAILNARASYPILGKVAVQSEKI